MMDQKGQVGGKTETESKEINTLVEGTIMGFARNLALGKFPKIHKADSR